MQSNILITDALTTLDWSIFGAILLITLGSIFYGEWKKKSLHTKDDEEMNFLDILIMGRGLTLPLFVGTLVATWYGGIFGVTEIAFNQGIYNFITQGLFWYVSYIIFALYLVHKVAPYQAVTLPDLIEKMFGPKSAKLAAVFNFFNVLPIAYVISLGLFIQLLTDYSLFNSMAIGLIFVVGYSMWGGLRAVVYSDSIQFYVMCLSVFLVLAFSAGTFGGLGFLKSNLPSTHFDPTGGVGIATTLVWGFIALSTLVDPNFYQRVFAAKSEAVARKGILISTVIWFCFDICTTFGAMYAKAVIPEAESGHAYLTYALQLLPNGLRGFFLAGILATILSTLDSYLFLAGTTLAYDLAPKKWKGRVWIHHFGVMLVAALSLVMATSFEGSIKAVWKTLGSYSASCLLFPVLVGHLFPGRLSDKQFITSSLLGVVAVTYWRNASHSGFWSDVDELYIGLIVTGVALGVSAFRPNATKAEHS